MKWRIMKKSEFRFNKKRKHPSYVFKEKNNKYHSILITHSPMTKNKINIKLYKNPEPNNKTDAYLVKKIYKDDINSYSRQVFRNWKFHKYDKRNVKRIKKNKK